MTFSIMLMDVWASRSGLAPVTLEAPDPISVATHLRNVAAYSTVWTSVHPSCRVCCHDSNAHFHSRFRGNTAE
jgi:hypothetical protein